MSARSKDGGQRQQAAAPMPRNNLTLIAGVIGALLVIIIIIYAVLHGNRAVPGSAVATGAPDLPPQLTAGTRAPAFELPSKIGSFSSSSLAGTPYLLEIFATWCPHCQRMTKVLRAIRAQVPASKLAMVSVTGSPYAANSTPDNLVPENQADVDTFESTYGVTWPSLLDTDLVVAKKFGLNGFPTIFIVNRLGTIVYAGSGEVSQNALMNAIRQAGG
jgi:thiol-disulfide isomerase/thioredoxin